MQRVFNEGDAVPHGTRRLSLLVAGAVVMQVYSAAQCKIYEQGAA
jgi:hypothetical protein